MITRILRFTQWHQDPYHPTAQVVIDVIAERINAVSETYDPYTRQQHAVLHLIGGEQITVTLSVAEVWQKWD